MIDDGVYGLPLNSMQMLPRQSDISSVALDSIIK